MIIDDIYNAGLAEQAPIKYEFVNKTSLKMVNHRMPWSISSNEMQFIHDTVTRYGLRNGYEMATAFGASTIAMGLAIKNNGGKLVTMDAYIEEQYNDCAEYEFVPPITYPTSDGFASVLHLLKHFNLSDAVFPTVGWSPRDASKNLFSVFSADDKIDIAFIDGLHCDAAVLKDIEAIRPFLADKFVLFLHDVHCFSGTVVNYLRRHFGRTWKTVPNCTWNLDCNGFNLSYVTSIDNGLLVNG